jgi:LysR family transcriptional regulator for metE and metH
MNRPTLDIKHLEMIVALAETPRVTEAAERLRITPSALSHRIREVERRLEVPLFMRVHKRLRPTPAADYLAQVAERLLADMRRAEDDVRKMARGVKHVVRLAVESYSAYHWLPDFLRYLREIEPDIGVEVVAAASRNTLSSLHERTVDLIIISGEINPAGIKLVPMFEDQLRFVMPPGHRLADRDYIEGADIVGEDFITYTRVPEPDREYERLFRPSNAYPNWIETVEVPEAIVEMVAAGLGTSVLAGWAVSAAIDSGRIVAAKVGAASAEDNDGYRFYRSRYHGVTDGEPPPATGIRTAGLGYRFEGDSQLQRPRRFAEGFSQSLRRLYYDAARRRARAGGIRSIVCRRCRRKLFVYRLLDDRYRHYQGSRRGAGAARARICRCAGLRRQRGCRQWRPEFYDRWRWRRY